MIEDRYNFGGHEGRQIVFRATDSVLCRSHLNGKILIWPIGQTEPGRFFLAAGGRNFNALVFKSEFAATFR